MFYKKYNLNVFNFYNKNIQKKLNIETVNLRKPKIPMKSADEAANDFLKAIVELRVDIAKSKNEKENGYVGNDLVQKLRENYGNTKLKIGGRRTGMEIMLGEKEYNKIFRKIIYL